MHVRTYECMYVLHTYIQNMRAHVQTQETHTRWRYTTVKGEQYAQHARNRVSEFAALEWGPSSPRHIHTGGRTAEIYITQCIDTIRAKKASHFGSHSMLYVHTQPLLYVCLWVCIRMHVHIYVRTFIRTYMCTVCIYVHTHNNTSRVKK